MNSFEEDLEGNLQDLCERVHTGRYRPLPVRRVYIPKSDGGQRPLGIPALEDKIIQGAVAEVLSAIYEVDFLGFSYGFRPGRDPHQALDALHTALMSQRVCWVLDADIRNFFDSVDHEEDIRRLNLAEPFDLREAKVEWREALALAEIFARQRPPEELGCLYYSGDENRFTLPEPEASLDAQGLVLRFGAPGGVIPRVVEDE